MHDGTPRDAPQIEILGEHVLACGLEVDLLADQSVHGKVSVDDEELGIVTGGLQSYLDERSVGTIDLPETYSSWEEGFRDASPDSPRQLLVVYGALTRHRENDSTLRLAFTSDNCRAAVRLATGGGRFDSDELTFHSAAPVGVVEGPRSTVAIAPCYIEANSEGESPAFTHESQPPLNFEPA